MYKPKLLAKNVNINYGNYVNIWHLAYCGTKIKIHSNSLPGEGKI